MNYINTFKAHETVALSMGGNGLGEWKGIPALPAPLTYTCNIVTCNYKVSQPNILYS